MITESGVRYSSFIGAGIKTGHIILAKDCFEFVSDDSMYRNRNSYACISGLEIQKLSESIVIQVICRDFANFTLFLSNDPPSIQIAYHIQNKINITSIFELPAFTNPLFYSIICDKNYGWAIYNKREDFNRMCGHVLNNFIESSVNAKYDVCPTYPNVIFVPKGIRGQNTLMGSSKFRSKGRLPVLSYFYNINNTCIIRCAQPLSGLRNKCYEDIHLLRLFWEMNEPNKKLHIYDARPKINAMANKAQGKGFEDLKDYDFCCFDFLDIPNIHVVRDSIKKYVNVVRSKFTTMSSFWQLIHSTNWPTYIVLIIQSSLTIASVFQTEIIVRSFTTMVSIVLYIAQMDGIVLLSYAHYQVFF
uniref:Myotubularin-related protein 8 (Trinotate prediction) n=1 Tax=Henneguya salminicola TaxID=69463 RepID=A0A6G3MDW4_HENSL